MSEPGGAIIWSWISDPFGDSTPDEDPDGDGQTFTLNLRFAGQYYDSETGFYQNWHRDYDPASGRYVTSDPIGLAGGLNTYGYALQNPTEYLDPTGLGPVAFWVCTGANAAYSTYSFQQKMEDITEAGELQRELLVVVNEEIENCPPEDIERRVELERIRDDLEEQILEQLSRSPSASDSAMASVPKAAAMEAVCVLIFFTPTP